MPKVVKKTNAFFPIEVKIAINSLHSL